MLYLFVIFQSWRTVVFHPLSEPTSLRLMDATGLILWPVIGAVVVLSIKHRMAWRAMERHFMELTADFMKIQQNLPAPSRAVTIGCPICHDRIKLGEAVDHVNDHLQNESNPAHESKPLAAIIRHPGDENWSVVFQEKP